MTTGDVHPFLRLTRQGRSPLLHAGKLMVPTISVAETIFPARVAPSSAISEKLPFSTRGKVEKIKGTAAVYAHEALTSVLSRISNPTAVSVPLTVKPAQTPFISNA